MKALIYALLLFSKRPHSWPSAVYINLAYKTMAKLDGDSVLVEVSFSCGGKLQKMSELSNVLKICLSISTFNNKEH